MGLARSRGGWPCRSSSTHLLARDLDNVQKALLDSIEHAGVIEDDSMIDDLHTIRKEVIPSAGKVIVTITSIEKASPPR